MRQQIVGGGEWGTILAMIAQLAEIFFNVITPVFALVLIGYVAGPRLGLQARTLSRFAYFILIPCFVFNVIATAEFDPDVAGRMVVFILLVELACAALGFAVARLLRRTAEMTAAYVLIATFGNVGNFGLPLIEFRLGAEALLPATIYFLAIIVIAFVIGVGVASWTNGGSLAAITAVLKTPALIAIVPAALVNGLGVETPLLVSRTTGLLGAAMVPTMLVALGVQLAEVKQIRLGADVWISSAVRLLGGAALALLIVIPFGLTGIERGAGIFQAAMPTAVLASIIAMEYKLLPDFVTTVVLFSTVASVITLTLLLAFV
ncbi:MAG: AEC family transporter [Anaerolineales bacterium]|nr:AEC family transporter [Anaerolineales bacterium]